MLILKGFKNFLYDLYHNRTTILVILIYIVITQVLFHTVCPIAIIFGFPCPACGLTRAGICLLTGRFLSAFYMNPCIFLLIPYFFYLWIFKYILEKKPSFLTPVTISLSIAVISIYIIRIWTHTLPEISMRGAFVFHYFINISSFIQTYFHTDYFTILWFSVKKIPDNPIFTGLPGNFISFCLCKIIQFVLHQRFCNNTYSDQA